MVDDRGQAAVGVDPPIFGGQMIALEHVHREQLVRQHGFFEHDRNLVAVARGGEINADPDGFPSAKRASAADKPASTAPSPGASAPAVQVTTEIVPPSRVTNRCVQRTTRYLKIA